MSADPPPSRSGASQDSPEFVDMIPAKDYDVGNIVPAILQGELGRRQLRERIFHLNQLLNELVESMKAWCNTHGYRRIFVPNIVSTIGACENWKTLFKVNHPESFFHLLTQTGQLFLEGALCETERVWCLTKSFRKERLEDHRHLVEFHLFEIEGAFGFDTLLEEMRALYRHALGRLREWPNPSAKRALGLEADWIEQQRQAEMPEVSYSETIALSKTGAWGDDLREGDEATALLARGGGGPILVTRFPTAIKFFNMAVDAGRPETVLSVDLVLPHSGEAAGGAEREDDYPRLLERLRASGMYRHHLAAGGTHEDFEPYLALIQEHAAPRHSGCGLGLERVIQSLLREADIRLCSVDYLTKMLFAWDALRLPD